MAKTLSTTYNPSDYETKLYSFWQEQQYFKADAQNVTNNGGSKKPFTILIPPPNVTDRLHMGHGLNNTLQDILIRWKRMSGYEACWLPGTDHAGIATQMMVEKDLEKQGETRKGIGRDSFTKRTQEWKEKYGNIIIEQLKRLGCSADWSRLAYTMDPGLSRAVREIFVKLYDEGKIYRGERLVNWDPSLLTALSDDEVENIEKSGTLWHIAYSVVGQDSEKIVVATTRPETMFGDVAVAVHPDDERYSAFVGKKLKLPLTQREIPIIADSYVKSEFGTGAVKITPAHDFNDFEVGQRNQLPMIDILNERACLNQQVPAPYQGMNRFDARKKVLKELREQGLLVEEKPHKLSVPISSRSKDVIEPRISKQWYLKMAELAEPAIAAAKRDQLKFYPEAWKKTYLYWLENIRDWCISRQLWWGHRMPVWYCRVCEKETCTKVDPTECAHCGSKDIDQDQDVLDTWFSSWLWPVSPFGWPDESQDMQAFFPSNVLITGPDIIYLWVARMVMLGYSTRGELPFKDVYFNTTICDKTGKKFSKTLGNGIDPLEMIDKYGADAVRFTCVHLAPTGGRVKMSKGDFVNGSKFINKIWNASRFVLSQQKSGEEIKAFETKDLHLANQWLVESYEKTSQQINFHLNNYNFNEAISCLYKFFWSDYCDWGIEASKHLLEGENRAQTLSTLIYCLEGAMRLASPFIPFVAEEIWNHLPEHPLWQRAHSLMICEYPKVNSDRTPSMESSAGFESWQKVQDIIVAIRSTRAQVKAHPKDQLKGFLKCDNEAVLNALEQWSPKFANTIIDRYFSEVKIPKNTVVKVGEGFELYCVVESLDVDVERKRLCQEQKRITKILKGIEIKISKFNENVPQVVIQETKRQQANMDMQLSSVVKTLRQLADD